MPKDEFDFEDPMELTGVALLTDEDTTDAMCDCFIEEFMRMGFDHTRILGLFRNAYYIGMNMVLKNRGEQFVRDRIADVFAQWGREVTWAPPAPPASPTPPSSTTPDSPSPSSGIDPTGSPAPTYNL